MSVRLPFAAKRLCGMVTLIFCVFFMMSEAFAAFDSAAVEGWKGFSQAQRQTIERLYQDLRCPACTHQSLAISDAPIAHDMRAFIRTSVQAGLSAAQIKDQLIDSYGEQVLMTPTPSKHWFLWLAPLGAFLLAVLLIILKVRPNTKPKAGSPL